MQRGTCGDNVKWKLDDDGTLTISGKGAMKNYSFDDAEPWYIWRKAVRKIVIADGVTYIGSAAFSYCTNATELAIADSVTYIDRGAFYGCSGLTEVTIPAGVCNIGKEIFAQCDSLQVIYYPAECAYLEENLSAGNDADLIAY